MKKTFLKILCVTTMLLSGVFAPFYANAVSVSGISSEPVVGLKQQFYVDIMLDPQSIPVNGIEGMITYSRDLLSFVRAEDGKSMVNAWIEKPTVKGDTVVFSGIMTSGFSGVIDPFNAQRPLPGNIMRLVFEAKKHGKASIGTSNVSVTRADGNGTVVQVSPASTSIEVQNILNPMVYRALDDSLPELTAYVVRDQNLFENRYAVVFDARDKESGIKSVVVKEGNGKFIEATSPYLLEDQTRHSIIIIQAANFAGMTTAVTIGPLGYDWTSPLSILVYVIIVVLGLFVTKKIHARKK